MCEVGGGRRLEGEVAELLAPVARVLARVKEMLKTRGGEQARRASACGDAPWWVGVGWNGRGSELATAADSRSPRAQGPEPDSPSGLPVHLRPAATSIHGGARAPPRGHQRHGAPAAAALAPIASQGEEPDDDDADLVIVNERNASTARIKE